MIRVKGSLWLMSAAVSVLALACSSGTNNGTTTGTVGTAGNSGSTTSAATGTTGAHTSASSTSATATSTTGSTATATSTTGGTGGTTTGGSPCTAGQSLFACYGGAPTVAAVVQGAEGALLGDCVTAPYFANLGNAALHYETVDNLTACLNLFFAAALGGPAHYPGVTGPEYDSTGAAIMGNIAFAGDAGFVYDSDGGPLGQAYTCSGMRDAHSNAAAGNADLGVTPEAFDEFVADVGGVLAHDGVAATDIATIAGAVTGFKHEVVSYYPQTFQACIPGMANDAGMTALLDGGVSGYPGGELTLWTKYGGGPTITTVVGQAEGKLTTDCVTSPYFYGLLTGDQAAGYETLPNLSACLNQFFTAAFSGPANYPGVTANYPGYNADGTENFGFIEDGNKGTVGDGGGYYFDTAPNSDPMASITNVGGATYSCENMLAAHNRLPDGGGNVELGISDLAFTEFVTDVAGILQTDGVATADITALGGALNSFQTQVVATNPIGYAVCDGGLPDGGVDGGLGD